MVTLNFNFMNIKESITKNVNQLVESHIANFESKYIPFLIGNEVIKIHVKLDAKIESVEYETDSKEPVINELVKELNGDYAKPYVPNFHIPNMFFGSKSNPMLQIDDKYFLCMVGMPHQVTRFEYNNPLLATVVHNVPFYDLTDGDWVWMDIKDNDISSFALVYRASLYFWNFSQVEQKSIEPMSYTKLIFQ